MNKVIKITQSMILAGLIILLMYSCADKKWDDYYVRPEYIMEGSIMDVLAGIPEYKEFSGLIRKTGYDSLLKRNENYTVFALTNGSFSNIDTNDIAALKKIIGNHIVPAVVFSDRLADRNLLTVSGKLLRVSEDGSGLLVNNKQIISADKKVANGVIHEIQEIMEPLPNMDEIIQQSPWFSVFRRFIDSSYVEIIDLKKNLVIGYDSLGKPVYKEPIIYLNQSSYASSLKAGNDSLFTTVFVPDDDAMDLIYSRMLAARNNDPVMIVPRLYKTHGDTVIGNRFFPAKMEYPGDSGVIRDYIFRNNSVRGDINNLSGTVNLKNLAGNNLTVNTSHIENPIVVSNGMLYQMNDFVVPDSMYRPTYILRLEGRIINPANPTGARINNPAITYSPGASVPGTDTNNGSAFGGKFTYFYFNAIGVKIDFTMPNVMSGRYQVVLIGFYPNAQNGGGLFRAYYGTQFLKQFASHTDTNRGGVHIENIVLGIVDQPASGSFKITVECVSRNRVAGAAVGAFSALMLQPVSTP